MTVLVTNDDGVASAGLHALARALVDAGHDVLVVAPDREMSGCSAAIGQIRLDDGIDAKPVDLPGLAGVPAFAVAGPPGLCVLAARIGGFGDPPDIVVSGINPGCNTGRAVLHSGTVGAALTGAGFGCRALAVSLDVSSLLLHESGTGSSAGVGLASGVPTGPAAATVPAGNGEEAVAAVVAEPADPPARWETAAGVAASLMGWLAESPAGTVLNVNVPNLPRDQLAGARLGQLAAFGTVRSTVVQPASAGTGRLELELRPTEVDLPPDSDTALVREGYVAISPLVGPRVDEGVDVTGALGAVAPAGVRGST